MNPPKQDDLTCLRNRIIETVQLVFFNFNNPMLIMLCYPCYLIIVVIKNNQDMTSATPSSLTLGEKKRLWQQTKYKDFEEISQDKSSMFNYFLENNDLFRMISEEDEVKFRVMEEKCENEKQNVFFGSLGAIFFIDQILFRYALPGFQATRFRFTVNFLKYLVAPCLISYVYRDYFMGEYQIYFYNLQEKYQFGFNDFMKGNRIFERALAVDRLDELFEKRTEFDWTGIPELPDEDKKQEKAISK